MADGTGVDVKLAIEDAGGIGRRECPKIAVVVCSGTGIFSVVLGDRLDGPAYPVPGDVLHHGKKTDPRRAGIDADVPGVLKPTPLVGWSFQLDGAGIAG